MGTFDVQRWRRNLAVNWQQWIGVWCNCSRERQTYCYPLHCLKDTAPLSTHSPLYSVQCACTVPHCLPAAMQCACKVSLARKGGIVEAAVCRQLISARRPSRDSGYAAFLSIHCAYTLVAHTCVITVIPHTCIQINCTVPNCLPYCLVVYASATVYSILTCEIDIIRVVIIKMSVQKIFF
jgi:hypothetical protein